MEPLLAIPVIGLALALAAALVVMRRRADEIARLEDELRAQLGAGSGAPRVGDARAAVPAFDTALEPGVADLLPVGMLHLDATGRVDAANVRSHVLLGVATGRLVGRSVMETFVDARIEAQLEGIGRGGTASAEIRTGGAEPHTVMLRAHRRPDGSGGLDIVLEDVTELRRLQQIRTVFLDNLSHELRTPLSTVCLLAETLARDAERADVPQRMRERIAKIEVETGHLVQMVSELLDLARIEGGSQLSLEDDVDLGRLAGTSAERLRLFAERQGVTLVVDARAGVPTVRGDEARLGQVLINLVHNAVKFSPDGGEVRVAVTSDERQVTVTVTDHGIGISKPDRARVFERFYKADRARVRGGGTGLGLAIARHIVEGHGGHIDVESEQGRGSTFAFSVPLELPAPDIPDAPPGVPSGAALSPGDR